MKEVSASTQIATAEQEHAPPDGEISSSLLTAPHEVPRPKRIFPRTWFLLIQLMYLIFYISALANLGELEVMLRAAFQRHLAILILIVVSAGVGIPIRLYLLSAVSFDYRHLPEKFRRLFLPLFVLDELWAFAPFLVMHHIGFGWAMAATAGLLYLPFSQRTLLFMGYPAEKQKTFAADERG